jgi:hypothetical protein
VVAATGEDRTDEQDGALRRWWASRSGAALVREVATVVALLALYRLGRALGRHEVGAAFDHAKEVLRIERHLGLAYELDWQRAALPHRWLITALNQYYARVHFPATIAFLVGCYVRSADGYRHVRRLFVGVTAAGLVLHLAYPLAPPRMQPGFVDTIARFGPAIYSRGEVASVANQYAAMPSLHFGWAVLVAYGAVRLGRRWWRWLAVAHPVVTFVAIVVTANHYWLDAAVAAALVVAALLAERHFLGDRRAGSSADQLAAVQAAAAMTSQRS